MKTITIGKDGDYVSFEAAFKDIDMDKEKKEIVFRILSDPSVDTEIRDGLMPSLTLRMADMGNCVLCGGFVEGATKVRGGTYRYVCDDCLAWNCRPAAREGEAVDRKLVEAVIIHLETIRENYFVYGKAELHGILGEKVDLLREALSHPTPPTATPGRGK